MAAAVAISLGTPVAADVAVDFATTGGDGQAAWCASSVVAGLDPAGDNFLAVRTGPGTGYPMLAKLGEGAVVRTCANAGPWVGVLYGPAPSKGWVHGRWLVPYAG
jgi:uncharacterized protein YraI